MPANAHYSLAKYLNIVRLYPAPIISELRSAFSLEGSAGLGGLYNVYMQACSYDNLYIQNLVVVIAIAAVLLIVWVGSLLIGCTKE